MKTIIYKTPIEYYECADIIDNGGDEIRFIFDKPIDAKLTIGSKSYAVAGGVCRARIDSLSDGEIKPKLHTGGRTLDIEGFFCRDGVLIKKCNGEEYARHLGEKYGELTKRIALLEEITDSLSEKITQKIKF